MDPVQGNMRIDIAAADEDRGARQRASVVAAHSRRADQSGTQTGYSSIASRLARHELEREATALRKPEQHNSVGCNAPPCQVTQNRSDGRKRPRQKWLVPLWRCEKRLWIPGVT